MRTSLRILIAALFFCQAHAATIEKPLPDPAQEQQARTMFHALRCVVCEGQSLAESDAVLAVQMRSHIRALLAQGKTPDEIYATFRTSYGERILMNPPLENHTVLLWAAPLLLLVAGAFVLRRITRTQGAADHG